MMIRFASIFLMALFSLYFTQSIDAQQTQRRNIPPMLIDGKIAAYVTFDRPMVTQAMVMKNPEGNTYKEDVHLGSSGIQPAADSSEPYFNFQIATDQLIQTTGTFYVSVQYLDAGQSTIEIEYHQQTEKEEEPVVKQQSIFLGNSGFWEEHTFRIDQVFFDHQFANDTDLRLYCPDVLIRHISVSRAPLGKPRHQQFDTFRQTAIQAPIGFEYALHIPNESMQTFSRDLELMQNKVKLYRSWSVQSLVETVDINELFAKYPNGETHPIVQRAQFIQQQRLQWVPRFKIGDVNQIPLNRVSELQRAETDGGGSGPMISLWEPKLKTVYSEIFLDLKQRLSAVKLEKLSLSFAGDWGPLLLSTEQDGGQPGLWISDPFAKASLVSFLRNRYGTLTSISSHWKTRITSWDEAASFAESKQNSIAQQTLYEWQQQSLLNLIVSITQTARVYFPKAQLEVEVGDQYLFGAHDFSSLVTTASQFNFSLVMAANEEIPTQSYTWLLMASAAKRAGVTFGLRSTRRASSTTLLAALFSLASEGGTLFHFDEEKMKPQNAWRLFSTSSSTLRSSYPQRNTAVIFPRTSILNQGDKEFARIVSDLRERIAFDLIDERDMQLINASQYPLIIVPWGHIWQPQSLETFDSIARSGSALIVKMEQAWQTQQEDRSINERLFAVKLEQKNGKWIVVSRNQDSIVAEQNSFEPADRRNVRIGQKGDDAFLSGKWSEPENQETAETYGFPFESFRWFRERAVTTLPMLANRDYELQIDGYIADGYPVDVYVNKKLVGSIQGSGSIEAKIYLEREFRPHQPQVQILLRGQDWNTGKVLGAPRPSSVTMAVSRIALLPIEKENKDSQIIQTSDAPAFRRAFLRGSYLRETGRGITLVMPEEHVSDWLFMELISQAAAHPKLLDPRYRFSTPPDGEANRIFVSPQLGVNLYLNVSGSNKVVGSKQNLPQIMIPAQSLYYTN